MSFKTFYGLKSHFQRWHKNFLNNYKNCVLDIAIENGVSSSNIASECHLDNHCKVNLTEENPTTINGKLLR